MFYSSQLLSRKTALGICWLASHLESKRLKRAQVFEVSIAQSCDSIINPEAPLALRLSGQLLLGVVRIYQRKLTFLETDAKNAIEGLQRKEGGSQNVDLPDGGTAPEMAITLPDADPGLLAGAELFPSFAIAETPGMLGGSGGAGGAGLAARLAPGTESLTFADDISDVLGSSRWTASEERFDLVGGEDIDRRFSAELERLRSAAAVEPSRAGVSDLFYDAPMDDSYGPPGGMDEIMEPPAEDLFVMPPLEAAGPTPGSIGGAPGTAGNLHITPPSLGAFTDGLPDLGGGFTGPTTAGGASPSPARGRSQQKGQKRKKRVQIDVTSDGMPATQLPSEEMRRLLNNRAPLLKQRATAGEDAQPAPEAPPRVFDVRAQSEAARESFMYRPACCDRLDPDLMSVFNRALGVTEDGKLPSAAAARRGAAAAGASPQVADAFATSPAEPMAAPAFDHGGAPSPAPSWGFDDFGGGPADSDGGYFPEPDHIENSQDGAEEGPGSIARLSAGGREAAPLALMTSSRDQSLHRVSLGGFVEEEPSVGGAAEPAVGGLAADGFTARTKVVLDHLAERFTAPASGSKRRHPGSTSAPAPAIESLALDGLVAGRPRLEACRWFFEALVLRNKGYVDLQQDEPYGEISILPMQKLMDAHAQEQEQQLQQGGKQQRRATITPSAA